MRLSEAIAVGRTLVANCVPGGSTRKNAQPGDGCVLDMAALAMGRRNWEEARDVWPWLEQLNGKTHKSYEEEIYQRFDFDVMRKGMTLEQLIDYVRSVEPAEEFPTPTEAVAIAADAVVTKSL